MTDGDLPMPTQEIVDAGVAPAARCATRERVAAHRAQKP
jgi:hypothetical protein